MLKILSFYIFVCFYVVIYLVSLKLKGHMSRTAVFCSVYKNGQMLNKKFPKKRKEKVHVRPAS